MKAITAGILDPWMGIGLSAEKKKAALEKEEKESRLIFER